MDTNELKLIMNSLYGFTATQLIQQISAINALERTLEDIKKGASWQSLDLCIESAISTLEAIKNTPGINSERSEERKETNIDYIRSLSVKKIASLLHTLCTNCYLAGYDDNDYYCKDCTIKEVCPHNNSITEFTEWMVSERSEKLPTRNIDYIRSITAAELADIMAGITSRCSCYCTGCPLEHVKTCGSNGILEWLLSERSEKEENDE